MADYSPVLKKILRKAGCRFERKGKGDHEIWYSPITMFLQNRDRSKMLRRGKRKVQVIFFPGPKYDGIEWTKDEGHSFIELLRKFFGNSRKDAL